jgi:ABC-type transport system substrate-binding protein
MRRSLSAGSLALALGLTGTSVAISQDAGSDQGGTLSIAWEGGIDRLDPALGYDFISWPAERLMFDTLLTYDEGTTLVPGLAAAMPTISDDGLTLTFELRPDVAFVRKGEVVRTMTADDVVHSLNRLLRQDMTPYGSPVGETYFGVIEGADAVLAGTAEGASGLVAVDPLTFQVTLTRPDRVFLNALAMPFGSIVPTEAGLDSDAFEADPFGTGPYFLESYAVGELATFRRNPHYWAAGLPKADVVELRLSVPVSSQFLAVSDGSLDLMGDPIAPADWTTVSADPVLGEQLVQTDIMQLVYLALDTGAESAFADPRVRQAISHAIDKQNLVRLHGGRAQAAGCLLPPTMPGFDAACDPYPYDPDRAAALMTEAGVAPFTTQLYTDTPDLSVNAAQAIASDLATIGITVEVIEQDFDTLLGTISTPHAAPMVYIPWYADFPDPSNFMDPILTCATAVEGGANISWFCDESIDADLEAARGITDLEEAIPIYQDIQERIMAQAPLVPALFPTQTGLRSDRVPSFEQMHPVWFWDLATIPVVE